MKWVIISIEKCMPRQSKPDRIRSSKKPFTRCCIKCNIELSWRELVRTNGLCFVCERIENDKNNVATEDKIQYDS